MTITQPESARDRPEVRRFFGNEFSQWRIEELVYLLDDHRDEGLSTSQIGPRIAFRKGWTVYLEDENDKAFSRTLHRYLKLLREEDYVEKIDRGRRPRYVLRRFPYAE